MVTPYEYALLSKLAYSPEEARFNLPSGWNLVDEVNHYGYQAVTFKKGSDIVIAHRGTDDPKDIISNSLLYLKTVPTHAIAGINYAYEIQTKYGKGFTYSHTGHSLGGAVAELIALETRTTGVSFDAPGIKETAEKVVEPSKLTENKIISFVSAPNIVNTVGKHITLPAMLKFETKIQEGVKLGDYVLYSLDQHKIENIIKALKAPHMTVTQEAWPSSFTEGYERFISYEHNRDYLAKFLKQAWDRNHNLIELVTSVGLLGFIQIKDIFRNFEEFKNYMIENELNGESNDLASLEERFNNFVEHLKENKFVKVATDLFSNIFAINSASNDEHDKICSEDNLSEFVSILCGLSNEETDYEF